MSDTPISITELDLKRLENLLETESVGRLPGVAALQVELDRAHVVPPEQIAPDVVTMNSTVRFIDEQASKEYELTLVYPHQAGKPGTVSILAPVGSALLGLSVGQDIGWRVPGGNELRLTVIGVISQPEAQGQFHR